MFVRLLPLLLLVFTLSGNLQAAAAVAAPAAANTTLPTELTTAFAPAGQTFTAEDFLALTPRKIRETTGRKLSLKASIGLKLAQRKVKKSMKAAAAGKAPAVLAIVIGGLGIHRFYLGYTTIGILQILTLGGCGIWTLIDIIRIATGDLLPADGSAYDPEL